MKYIIEEERLINLLTAAGILNAFKTLNENYTEDIKRITMGALKDYAKYEENNE